MAALAPQATFPTAKAIGRFLRTHPLLGVLPLFIAAFAALCLLAWYWAIPASARGSPLQPRNAQPLGRDAPVFLLFAAFALNGLVFSGALWTQRYRALALCLGLLSLLAIALVAMVWITFCLSGLFI